MLDSFIVDLKIDLSTLDEKERANAENIIKLAGTLLGKNATAKINENILEFSADLKNEKVLKTIEMAIDFIEL